MLTEQTNISRQNVLKEKVVFINSVILICYTVSVTREKKWRKPWDRNLQSEKTCTGDKG